MTNNGELVGHLFVCAKLDVEMRTIRVGYRVGYGQEAVSTMFINEVLISESSAIVRIASRSI